MSKARRLEQLVRRQAERAPDRVAVRAGSQTLTYTDLVGDANRVETLLRERGYKPGDAIGLRLDRSPLAIAAMLGVWQAGMIVVPLSLAAPVEVVRQIVDDADVQALLTGDGPRLALEAVDERPDSAARPAVPSADDCYIYYTSGSRGSPKGVVGLHSSLVHYLEWHAQEFGIGPDDRFSQVAPLSFDFSLKEIFVPLIRGASVDLAEPAALIDPARFLAWVEADRLTVVCCVPTLFRALTEQAQRAPRQSKLALRSVRAMLISGDLLRWDDVRRWREVLGDSVPLYNLYGPTESTVIKLRYAIPTSHPAHDGGVPVGWPIDGAQVVLADVHDQPVASGELGEVVLLSPWLARGYRRESLGERPAFTHWLQGGQQVRAYRTGDVGRILADGSLELVGRLDRQVKVAGQRVELDGLEAALAGCPGVGDLAVVATGQSEALSITCYFTVTRRPATIASLRSYAEERLMPAAVPNRFVPLLRLPLSPNGKVDRAALSRLASQPPDWADAPLGEQLRAIWQDVLVLEHVELADSFFDLGGNSITAIRLLNRLRQGVEPRLSLTDVYGHASVEAMLGLLNSRVEEAALQQVPG
jgi:amino acid adenylation domain-containing protein